MCAWIWLDFRIPSTRLLKLANEIQETFGTQADIFYSPARTIHGESSSTTENTLNENNGAGIVDTEERVVIPATGRFVSRINYVRTNLRLRGLLEKRQICRSVTTVSTANGIFFINICFLNHLKKINTNRVHNAEE